MEEHDTLAVATADDSGPTLLASKLLMSDVLELGSVLPPTAAGVEGVVTVEVGVPPAPSSA